MAIKEKHIILSSYSDGIIYVPTKDVSPSELQGWRPLESLVKC